MAVSQAWNFREDLQHVLCIRMPVRRRVKDAAGRERVGALASKASCDGVRLSTSTVSRRLRSKYRAFSRRTIVSNQCFAAESSLRDSSDFQALSSDS